MAPALRHPLQDIGFDQPAGEWQALRSELVSLLDQVEGRFVRVPQADAGYEALAERMRTLRHQVTEVEPQDDRRQEALRSVQRAVQRFNERGEPMPAPTNPRDILQSAIAEIRGGARPTSTGQAPRAAAPRFDEFANAVNAMTGRLEQLEGELKVQRTGAQSIRDVADQVAQLTHVVELLAGAVGETGQVKRLEGQIAGLAQLIDQNSRPDLSALTARLDDVSATVERLADLQAQQIDYAQSQGNLEAVETSLRAIYDRIDAVERSVALPATEIDKLTDTMGEITEALRRGDPKTDRLLTLVDALHSRVGTMEERGAEVGALAADVEGLRDAVSGAMDPRFAALEAHIEALGGLVDASSKSADFTTLATQIRDLIGRMDETSAQINGLAALYEAAPAPSEPDYERIADMLSSRAAPAAIDARAVVDLESRVSASVRTAMDAAGDTFDTIRSGMRQVDDRLAKLENLLTSRQDAPAPRPAPAMPAAAMAAPAPAPKPAAPVATARAAAPERSDAMPANPADDAPLIDQGFGDPSPIKSALEAKANGRHTHPGLSAAMPVRVPEAEAAPTPALPAAPMPAAAPVQADRPAFDPQKVERPPRPESSLGGPTREPFAPPPAVAEPVAPAVPAPKAKTSTFIEAARRATQRQAAEKAQSGSLIGRALARINENAKAKADPAAGLPEAVDAPVMPAEKPAAPAPERRSILGRKPKATGAETVLPAAELNLGAEMEPVLPEPGQSFLARHSKAILLACSVVALTLMAVNLYVQRSADGGTGEAPATEQAAPEAEAPPSDVPPTAKTTDTVSLLPDNALVLPALDDTTTAAIGPTPELSFAPTAQMPAALQAAVPNSAILAPPVDVEASPVQFELPPEGLGPEDLRQAAANGDPRAQFEIAAIYTEGRVVPEDLNAAATWYERAAAQGFAPAQYRLGNLYENGKGVPQDLEQARLWYQRAAEAGNRMSMHNLASLYASGNLGQQEFAKAAEWFEQAADRGLTDSQFNLGMLYARGLGVKQDFETSFMWFSLAAGKGDKDAAKARDDVAASLDADGMARAKKAVSAWQATGIDMASNFAPIGTWSATFDPGQTLTNRDVVIKVQQALTRLGYDIGTPDGVAGPKTALAIRAFEHGTGMSETGQVNPRLLAVLGSQPV